MNELISIIIPVYNVAPYLERTLNSVCTQTYKNLEIILVDDGSTDGSSTICDEMAKLDERVKVIHKDNKGASDARNVGVVAATGEYIAFVDSDDIIMPDMYETLLGAIEENYADVAICNFCYVDEAGEELKNREQNFSIRDEVISGEEATKKLVGPDYVSWITLWNRLCRSEIVKGIQFPNLKICEDEYTAHMFFDKANKVVGVSKVCYHYVIRDNSLTGHRFRVTNLDYINALEARISYYVEREMWEEVCVFTKWMQRFLIRNYHYVDKGDDNFMRRFEECWEIYKKIEKEVKKVCSTGLVTGFLDICFVIEPKLTNIIYRRFRP